MKYWHTVRYLRPVQVYSRLWFRLYRPRPDMRPAPRIRESAAGWVAPVAGPTSMLGPETFRFLNATHVAVGAGAWNDSIREKLWLYNLHYFDDLNALDAPVRLDWHRTLLSRWVVENPPAAGNGWEPYPTSLRIVNWIKWALAGNALPPECLQSLAVQARWLRQRLEHHLLGNHLLANAKALVFAGSFFQGDEAQRWRERGRRILSRELSEQILPDGGHFERSPMYHAIVLEDVLDLVNLAEAYPETFELGSLSFYEDCARGMGGWLQAVCHPDGEISFFNDAAMGIAPTLAQLTDYGGRLGLRSQLRGAVVTRDASDTSGGTPLDGCDTVVGSTETRRGDGGRVGAAVGHQPPGDTHRQRRGVPRNAATARQPEGPIQNLTLLRDSGYMRLSDGRALVLLDVAPVGPDYLPGHAHADTLSFELSLGGQRVIVNGGTSRYGTSSERVAERGTAAHSTVQIDGADSSEVWGGFRVARRARPLDVHAEQAADRLLVSAAHDGYRRLPGRPVHRRTWELNGRQLVVSDKIDGRFGEAIVRFHLHPDVQAEGDGEQGRLRLRDGQQVRWQARGGEAHVVTEHWHPEFGLSVPACCLEVRMLGNACRMEFEWDIAKP